MRGADEIGRGADAGAGAEAQRGIEMSDRGIGLAGPHAEQTADMPTAREIRIEHQRAIDERHHGSDVLTEISQRERGIRENGGVVAAVCHGPAALVNLTLSDGSYLVDGKRVSAFTNDEEAAVGLSDAVPFALESKLIERGATFTKAANFAEHAVADRRLVTGQNPASATKVATLVLRELGGN